MSLRAEFVQLMDWAALPAQQVSIAETLVKI